MRHYRSQSLVLPLRSWFVMGSAAILLSASLTLTLLSSREQPAVQNVKHAIGDAATPVIAVASQPAEGFTAISDRLHELMTLDEENKRLRDENSELLHWQTAAKRLEVENASLRSLLGVRPQPGTTFTTAHVVAGDSSAFSRSLLLSSGSDDGVERDQAVIAEQGLVGRVIESGRHSAQVLLITDINSRLPVEIVETGKKAILSGDNSAHPKLAFENGDAAPLPGQHVVTAADGGVFPSGFAIGTVLAVQGGEATLSPFVNASRLSYVRSVSVK